MDGSGEHHLKWNTDLIQTQAILWKRGHTRERSLKREGQQKKEVKKVNMVDALPI
jgi:hypothetical protein